MTKLFALIAVFLLGFSSYAYSASSNYQSTVNYDLTATIDISTSTTVSNAVDLYGTTLMGVFIPSTFDGTTFTISVATTLDGTYYPVQSATTASTPWTATVAASQYVPIVISGNNNPTMGWRYLKITAGTEQETTDTVLTLATKAR